MGGAVNSSKKSKQLVIGLTIHRLIGRKDVVQMLHKMNSTVSLSDIIQQNMIWTTMAVSRKAVANNYKEWFKTVIKFTLPWGSFKFSIKRVCERCVLRY